MIDKNKESSYLSSPASWRGQGAAIILAGGLGTRLQSVVADVPKCMAPVAGRPFISYVIDVLRMQGIEHFIFSLGYKANVIEHYLSEHYPTLNYQCVLEKEPLGTGGAIKLACLSTQTENVLVVNGDTLFKIGVYELANVHFSNNAACTLALKSLENVDRYGVVELTENGAVQSFKEKQFYTEGLINGGVYLLNRKKFLEHSFPLKFSFEKDYLETYYREGAFYGSVQDGYFIDIGVPDDYNKAQQDLKQPLLDVTQIDKTWTLFLDRDGVINEERLHKYVLNWSEFHFSNGVLQAFPILNSKFGRVIIVSNQRGVEKGLMSEDDLLHIHRQMIEEVAAAGGQIDKIYYCTDISDKHFSRKPNPGMALQAAHHFKDIDLSKAIMVGNKPSDARFGRAAGMFTVFVTTTNPDQVFPHPDIDALFPTLLDFAQSLES